MSRSRPPETYVGGDDGARAKVGYTIGESVSAGGSRGVKIGIVGRRAGPVVGNGGAS